MGCKIIVISSLGRTGTLSLGQSASSIIENCYSAHELDVFNPQEPWNWWRSWRNGATPLAPVDKLFARYSLATLSVQRLAGKLSDHSAAGHIRNLRKRFYLDRPESVVLEANLQFAGVLDLVAQAFPGVRCVYIVRDPRDWVRSWMNLAKGWYSSWDWRLCLPHTRLRPSHLMDEQTQDQWRFLSRFDKLCWYWGAMNRSVLERIEGQEDIRVFRFEDLFHSQDKEQHLLAMLDFATDFGHRGRAAYQLAPSIFSRRLHATKKAVFPRWTDWSREQAESLAGFCGSLMDQLDYGREEAWLELLTGNPAGT